jgi:glycosyltransferase involved in cell wall biosynthesis
VEGRVDVSNSLPTVTVSLTYFKSLTLDHLRAALHSIRKQAFLDSVQELVVVDNDTADTQPEIAAVINEAQFTIPTRLLSFKHGDANKTHSWSANVAFRESRTNWTFFTRADYLLDPGFIVRCLQQAAARSQGWDGFVTGDCFWLHTDIAAVEATAWRREGAAVLRNLPGTIAAHSIIDTGVWMTTRAAFERVNGLDENLTAWGHAQTHFQWKLHQAGTEMVRIPEVLYYHPHHGAPRDLSVANAQLAQQGIDIKDLWKRYDGEHIYR